MLTCSVAVENIGSNSVWQNRPEFLKVPVDTICHTLTNDNASLYDRHNWTVPQKDLNVIDLQRFSSYPKLLRVTNRLMNAVKARSFKAIGNDVSNCDMVSAEKLWAKEAQKEYLDDWLKRFRRLGHAINEEGLIVVGSRMKYWPI